MTHPGFFLRALALTCLLPLTGCPVNSSNDAQAAFSSRLKQLLANRDSAVIKASELTDFAWDQLCFERDDDLLARFTRGQDEQVIRLDYTQVFVDEPYVAHSLADQCIGYGDSILLKKKYPGYNDTIELQQPH